MRKLFIAAGLIALFSIGPIATHADDGLRLAALTLGRITAVLGTGSTAATNLGLGTAATQNTGISGATLCLQNSACTFSQFLAVAFNGLGSYPATGGGDSIGWNFNNLGETNLWNTYTASPAISFEFDQMTGASAKTPLARIGFAGNGGLMVPKLSADPTSAPGAGWVSFYAVAGTTGGTCKLRSMSGTSTTATTVLDNIGTGC